MAYPVPLYTILVNVHILFRNIDLEISKLVVYKIVENIMMILCILYLLKGIFCLMVHFNQ